MFPSVHRREKEDLVSQLEQLLQDKLNIATSELSIAQDQLNQAQRKVDSLTRRVDAFTHALAEERGEGNSPVIESKKELSAGTDNKSQIVRDLVATNAQFGTTVKDIRAAFTKAGVSFHPNYPYAVVRRLKENGSIKELRGKLYPAKTDTASE
jgi:hypothetical protein